MKSSDKSTPEPALSKESEYTPTSSLLSETVADAENGEELESSAVREDQHKREHERCGGVSSLRGVVVDRFEGDVEGEVFHGEGVAYFRDGHVYKGSFFHGLLHGFGEYIWSDGLKYQGEFKMNVPMGTGTYTWLDGSTYEGEVKQGLRHGFGTHKCAKTLAVYRGQWYLGKRQGKGLMHYNQEGTTWYEGEWLNNCREGWGKHHYPSGNVYEGEWRNNIRHGEGTMRWIDLDEQYSGQWVNGVQEGRGTHTWLRKRAPCSLYPRMNEYIGEVFQRMRHGRGDFFYASGAVYSGEWNHDRKHGQGRYVFEDGRVYEGEFIKDSIAEFPAFTPGLSGITSPFPDESEASKTRSSFSPLGSDIILNIQTLLTRVPENRRDQELKQVEFVVLRHIGLLREIYSFYSNLGHEEHPERTYPMTLLQFSRFLLDCRVHQCGITLAHMLRLVTEEACSPSTVILPRECISLIISVAYHIFHKDTESTKIISECFSKLMMQNIVPNAKNVKGYLFHHADVGSIYSERFWEIYQILSKAHSVKSVACITVRQFILMLQDLCLYDEYLTVSKVLKILSQESPAVSDGTYSNLDLEMSFLEFFEALLGCSEMKNHRMLTDTHGANDTLSVFEEMEPRLVFKDADLTKSDLKYRGPKMNQLFIKSFITLYEIRVKLEENFSL